MALSELEVKRYERELGEFLANRRPPAHVRPELDIEVRFSGQSVVIYEVRPKWDRPQEKIEQPVAKATYVKNKGVWRVYWIRRDLKWHRYDPQPEVPSLRAFGQLVHEDENACFFG